VTRLLVIMGSGETAPTMVKPHRAIFERVGAGDAIILDTPYGFQTNADDISSRAITYFADSVGRTVGIASWRDRDVTGLARERTLHALRTARWIFAGPGSPTYVLRQWHDTPIPGLLADRLRDDGVVVFASAAAITLGSHTIPVYEIYKAGVAPAWVPGLDLVRTVTGLPAVVIPHYDNAEGGHHDTRYCYLGEERLSVMEAELPPESFILGVDEHTAAVLDLDAATVTVLGNGHVTIRQNGHSIPYSAGDVIAFDALTTGVADAPRAEPEPSVAAPPAELSLRGDADRIAAEFDTYADALDVDGCVDRILALEQAITDWSTDTNESDEHEHARDRLRRMIVRLGEIAGAEQAADRALGPIVDVLLDLRADARASKDFATSDRIRDRLGAQGIEIRDTPDGATWHRP